MIRLVRLAKPQVLVENEDAWLRDFQVSGKARPPKSRYRHREIVAALRACSLGKCFYCERILGDQEGEVDHHVEVSVDRALAYAWENLYLACQQCNRRKVWAIRAADCADPFDPARDPALHLDFDATGWSPLPTPSSAGTRSPATI